MVGSYPKVTESGSDNLPGTLDRWQRRGVGDEALEEEFQKVIRRVVAEQESAGLDLVTDGQIRWEDLAHPVTRSSQGLSRGALRRFFDNNVYYRRLELNGGVSWKSSSVLNEFRFASSAAKKPVKVSLPGPLTLVVFTEMKKDQSREKLLSLYADLIRKEVKALVGGGVQEIQLEEPALAPGEPLLNQATDAINRIFKGIEIRRWVATYFSDTTAILPSLLKLEADVLSLDIVSAPKLLEALQGGTWKGEVALGLIDARNTKLESAAELKQQVAQALKAIPADRLWLTPNCGLEFLPHEAALKKLKLLQETARSL